MSVFYKSPQRVKIIPQAWGYTRKYVMEPIIFCIYSQDKDKPFCGRGYNVNLCKYSFYVEHHKDISNSYYMICADCEANIPDLDYISNINL